MRVFLLVATALLAAACSSGPEAGVMRRSGATDGKASKETTSTQRDDAPSTTDSPASSPAPNGNPTSVPAPAPTTSSSPSPTPTPAPAPPAGSCANPKCIAFGGTGGCKATDTNGATVVLGCDQGGCACLTGGQQTTAFEGNAATADDMKALFFANCSCL